jgi:hypothetical protein
MSYQCFQAGYATEVLMVYSKVKHEILSTNTLIKYLNYRYIYFVAKYISAGPASIINSTTFSYDHFTSLEKGEHQKQ